MSIRALSIICVTAALLLLTAVPITLRGSSERSFCATESSLVMLGGGRQIFQENECMNFGMNSLSAEDASSVVVVSEDEASVVVVSDGTVPVSSVAEAVNEVTETEKTKRSDHKRRSFFIYSIPFGINF